MRRHHRRCHRPRLRPLISVEYLLPAKYALKSNQLLRHEFVLYKVPLKVDFLELVIKIEKRTD